jgi:uncharacterized membrane protein YeaQ/YmgE (transglycosylase-associated protein family)
LLAFVLVGGAAGAVAGIVSPGGPEWGSGAIIAFVLAVVGGVAGALLHGAAVYVVLRTYAAMEPWYRTGASAAAAIAVLLALVVQGLLGIDILNSLMSLIVTLVGLPFGLSILAIAVVSRLPGARPPPTAPGT